MDSSDTEKYISKAVFTPNVFCDSSISNPDTIETIYANIQATLPRYNKTTDNAVVIPQKDTNIDFFILSPKIHKIVNNVNIVLKFIQTFVIAIYKLQHKLYNQIAENTIEVLILKKSIAILLACIVALSATFAACSSNKKEFNEVETSSTEPDGLEANADSYVLDSVEVTDKDGKAVTDKDGNKVTTDVAYKEKTDKKGNKVLVQIDDDGNEVTDNKGNVVTSTTKATTTKATSKKDIPTTSTTKHTNVNTSKVENPETTNPNLTTIKPDSDKVPSLSATGKACVFSQEDANNVAIMLMVPKLYNNSYENSDGVPTNIAAHAAIWMAEREGLNTSTFASGTIVLDLFKFFGQTVVNFKSKCNAEQNKDYDLTYSSSKDTFSISQFESATHSVSGLKFYSLGNNNYYKVEAKVSGCKYSKVTAIIQRNKLDSSLGFSIKALKWS